MTEVPKKAGLKARAGTFSPSRLDQLSCYCRYLCHKHDSPRFLSSRSLRSRREYFWSLYQADDLQALPDTANLRGYITLENNVQDVPGELRSYADGFLDA